MGVMNRSVQSLHVALPAINQHRLTRCGQQKARDWKSWLYCPTQWCSNSKKKNMLTTRPSLSHEIMKSGSDIKPAGHMMDLPVPLLSRLENSLNLTWVTARSITAVCWNMYFAQEQATWNCVQHPLESGGKRRRRGLTRDRPEGWQSVCWANPVMDTLWMDITQYCPPPASLHQIGKIQSAEG